MRKIYVCVFLILFCQTLVSQSNWDFMYAPKFRQLHDIHVLSLEHYVVVGGHPFNDSIRYMAYTIDGGANWSYIDQYLGKLIKTAVFINTQIGFASGYNSILYKTLNGGQTWDNASINLPISQLTVNSLYYNNGIIYASGGQHGGQGFIASSDDYGNAWNMLQQWPQNEIFDVGGTEVSKIRVCGNENFLKYSNDTGTTWHSATVLGLDSIVDFKSLSFYDDFGVCVGGRSGNDSLALILRSADGGETWTTAQLIQAPCLNSVFVVDDTTAYAVGDNGTILKTIDAGLSWQHEVVPQNPGHDLFAVNFRNRHIGGISGRWGVVIIYNDGFLTTPTITTDDATDIHLSSARLNTTVLAGNFPAAVSFLYGTQYPPGIEVFVDSVFGDTATSLYFDLTGLVPNTQYYFQAKVSNSTGDYHGSIEMFKTSHVVMTGPAANITATTVLLNGSVLAEEMMAVYFAYGNGFQPETEVFVDSFLNAQHIFLNYQLTGLQPITDYYYYIKASKTGAEYYGDTMFFQTLEEQNEAFTLDASQITSHNAVLNGRINVTNKLTAAYFMYGIQNPPNTEVFVDSFVNVQNYNIEYHLLNLQANTKYYYQVKLSNAYEETKGEVKTFFTGNPIPNWDFENWTSVMLNFPKEWHTQGMVQKEVCPHGGFAVSLIPANQNDGGSVLINFNPSDDVWFGGFATSIRPSQMMVSMKYDIEPGDSAIVFIGLKKQGHYISENWYFISGTSGGVFLDKTFGINYLNNDTPDTLLLGFTSSNPFNESNVFSSTMSLCGLAFDDPMLILPNMDFTEWVDVNYEYPDDWITEFIFDMESENFYQFASKSTDAFHNNYAVCLQTQMNLLDTLKTFSAKRWGEYFPVTERHETLEAYIKYQAEPFDTASISVIMYHNGIEIGGGHLQINMVVDWQKIQIPIHYWDTLLIPDGANILFSPTRHNYPMSSILCVDKLSFDGDFVPVENPDLVKPDMLVYPNPFKEVLYIDFKDMKDTEYLIEIFDISGKRVYSKQSSNKFQTIATSQLNAGLHLLRVIAEGNVLMKKVIKL